jgi:hypothetical protein
VELVPGRVPGALRLRWHPLGCTFNFWFLLGAGVLLLLIAPLINKLMHGVT